MDDVTAAAISPARRSALRLGIAALATLAGCERGTDGAPSGVATTTITALIWAPDWPEQMQQSAAAFSRAHPHIRVDLQFMIGNSVEENLKPKVAANQLPDLMSVNPNPYAAALADQGLLADVGHSAAWDNMLTLLKPDWTTPKKKRFGVAGGVAATLIYYNQSKFQQAGVPRPPTDFDQFLDTCARLKGAGMTPLVLAGGFPNMLANGPFSAGFANNVAARRPDWRQALEQGRLALDTPDVAAIFANLKLLATRGYLQDGYMNTGYDDALRMFSCGQIAMAFEGTWSAGALMADRHIEAGVFGVPWNAPGQTPVPVIGSETGFAVRNGPRQQAALMFVDFLLGAGFPLQQNQRLNVPPMRRVPQPVRTDPQVAAYVASISAAGRTVPPYYEFLPAATIELLHPLLQDVLSGKVSPQQAAASLDASVRQAAGAGLG